MREIGTFAARHSQDLAMALQRFMSEHPGCRVVRPDLIVPSLLSVVPALGCALCAWQANAAFEAGRWGMLLLWIAIGGALATALRVGLRRLRVVVSLIRSGRASIAIADEDVLLVDSGGNAVVVSLDRVTSLELDGHEARLRTDSDMQGVVYAILFRLFDEDAPGPSADRFFDLLAPRLRERSPDAVIVRHP